MSAAFELNHDKLRGDPRFAAIADELSKLSRIDSRETFNRYCQEACRVWSEQFQDAPIGQTSAHFVELLGRVERGGEGIIQTPWGGVVVTLHEHPRVEKYLVIREDGWPHPVAQHRGRTARSGRTDTRRRISFPAGHGALPDRNREPAHL